MSTKDRILNAIAMILGVAVFATVMFIGCRALNRNPELWL